MLALALILLAISHIMPVSYLGVQNPYSARISAGPGNQGLAMYALVK